MKKFCQSCVLIALCFTFTPGFAENNDMADVVRRITRLEEQKEILEGQRKNLEESYKNKLGDLDTKSGLSKKDIEQKIADMEDYRKTLDKNFAFESQKTDFRISKMEWFLGCLGVLTAGGLVSLWLGWRKLTKTIFEFADEKARTIFEERFKQRFEELFRAKTEEINRLIEAQNEDIQLKKGKSVLVLSKQGADESILKQFFKEMRFENVVFETFDASKQHDGKDVIMLNDSDSVQKFDAGEIEAYQKTVDQKQIFFYFGTKRITPTENSSYANSKMQLYGNLMNALRYRNLLGNA